MRRALLLAAGLALTASGVLSAQEAPRRRLPRRWIGAVIGAAVTSVATILYAQSEHKGLGNCTSVRCVGTLSILGGSGAGYLIGREFDQLYQQRYRHAPPMTLRGVALPLAVPPNDMATRDGVLAAAGEGGVEVIRAAGDVLEHGDVRARGLRGVITALPDVEGQRLLVGTTTGLYAYPLAAGLVAGSQLAAGEIAAVDVRGDRALLALGGALVEARLSADTFATTAPPRRFTSRVMDVAFDAERPIAWVLTESALLALAAPDSGLADSVGAVSLPGAGRRLALRGNTIAVATGEAGVVTVDGTDPGSPRPLARWAGARFVYDVAFGPRGLYIAGGPEGLFAVALRHDSAMTALGLARGLGFVSALDTDGGYLYILDRSGSMLRRVALDP